MEINSSEGMIDEGAVGIDLSLSTTVIYITFGLIGIVGNGLVLFVFGRVTEIRDITNLLIGNQSLIDFTSSVLLIAIFVVPLPPLPADNPILARFICSFWYTQFPFWSTYAATIVNLVVLTLERYFAVVHPIWYRHQASYKRAAAFAVIPWFYGFLHMCYLVPISNVQGQTCRQFQWPNSFMQPAMGVYTFCILFLAPFVVMTALYVRIVRSLRSMDSHLTKNQTAVIHEPANLRLRARTNIVNTMITLTVCYCICWAPNNIIYLYYCLGGYVDFNGVFYYVTVCAAFINIWINPFVYALQYNKFQQGLKKIFCCRNVSRMAPNSDTLPTLANGTTLKTGA